MRASLLWALALLAACAHQPLAAGGFRQLTSDEVRALIVGRYVDAAEKNGDSVPENWTEYFCRTGEWKRYGGRSVEVGSFDIDQGRLCVSAPSQPLLCRYVLAGPGGGFYTQNAQSRDRPPIRLAITNEPGRTNCK